jgi:hypothetical protein
MPYSSLRYRLRRVMFFQTPAEKESMRAISPAPWKNGWVLLLLAARKVW